jgi:predicted ester cyclase
MSKMKAIGAVRKLFTEVFKEGKFDVADQILTDDFRFQYPFPGFPPGPEGIKEFAKCFHNAFSGFELEINDIFGASGYTDFKVAIRWTFRGHHTGDFLGVKATNEYVTFSAIGFYGGGGGGSFQLSSGWLEMDTLGMLQQMRAVAPLPQILPAVRPVSL